MKQLKFIKSQKSEYGGTLLKARKGRAHGRPLDTKNSMHLVLRSTKAKGAWSMRRNANAVKVERLIGKFAHRYGVRMHSSANVGNHLHLHIQLGNRHSYRPFIRALTGAIAMAITGYSRWKKPPEGFKFWDYRPYSRVVFGWRGFAGLRKYVEKNQREGMGYPPDIADSMEQPGEWLDYAAEGVDSA